MHTKKPLAEFLTNEFPKFNVSQTKMGYHYQFGVYPNASFSLLSLIKAYNVFTAEEDAMQAMKSQVRLASMPIISLYKTGKHVQIKCPPLPYYMNVVEAVGGSDKGFGIYTVPIARAYDVVRAMDATKSFLPPFTMADDLKAEILKPLPVNSIADLYTTRIDELHAANSAYRVELENFRSVGYENLADMLLTRPRRYIDKTQITDFSDLEPKEPVTFIGQIVDKKVFMYKHASFDIKVANTVFQVTFYNRSWMSDRYDLGEEVLFSGEYSGGKRIGGQSLESLVEAKSLDIVPIYPQSPKNNITSKLILNNIYEMLSRLNHSDVKFAEYMPEVESIHMDVSKAFNELHFPSSSHVYMEALETLAFYEMTFLQLLIMERKNTEVKARGLSKPYISGGYFDAMKNSLPWELTDAQKLGLNKMNGYMSSNEAEQVLLSADVGSGKGLRETEQVLTPNGWRQMKDLKVGDYVVGSDGKPTRVTGVFPQGLQEVAEITFSDNTKIVTDLSHLWEVERSQTYAAKHPSGKRQRFVISTGEMLNKEKSMQKIPYRKANGEFSHYQEIPMRTYFRKSNGSAAWRIPLLSAPVEYDEQDELPFEPYLFGYWLGDGSHRLLDFAVGSLDLENTLSNFKELWDGEIKAEKDPRARAYNVKLRKKGLVMTHFLKDMGVYESKNIPDIYFTASVENRISLLQGLIDSDGSVDPAGYVSFGNTNRNLIDGVIEIVQSLGGVATVGKAHYKKYINTDGKKVRTKKPSWSVSIQLPPGIKPARLKRKADNYNENAPRPKRSHKLIRTIRNVELLPQKEKTICIKVDAEDELFITKDYIVTHNTVLAQLACMQAVDNGYQAVLAGPTEVLAKQLFDTFDRGIKAMPEDMRPTLAYLGGSTKAADKRAILKGVKLGQIDILVGTHSVLNTNIQYKNLGFIVIDEQQKFGSAQREALLDSRDDGRKPDLLAQTATPIPRSTAQAFYGDIDIIQLDGKPPGRTPVVTEWIKEDPKLFTSKKHEVWEDVKAEIAKGHQAFVVVPMVVESAKVDAASVEGAYKSLQKLLPGVNIGFMHGQMAKDKQAKAMEDFRTNETQLIVASTVIEVGVDVPNATRIVVLSADRMGASSLHQIRGRVGRSSLASKAYLVSLGKTDSSKARLQALVDSDDGFEIAKVDLKTRGEGDLFGLKQSGETSMTFANLVDHSKIISDAQAAAKTIYNSKYRNDALRDANAMLGKRE